MRTTFDLPDPLFRRLKLESALRGVKLKELVAELLQSGLARQQGGPPPSCRSPLPVIRKATGIPHPALSNREIENMLIAEDANGRS